MNTRYGRYGRYSIYLIIIGLILLLSFYTAFSADISNRGYVLKNFKALEYKMLFESDTIFLDSSTKEVFDSTKKMQLYKGVQEKVIDKRKFLEEKNIKILSKISNLKNSVIILEKDIKNLKIETGKINIQIVNVSKRLKKGEKTIQYLKTKISRNKKIINTYMIYLYKKGNYLFKDGKVDNFRAIFFGGNDISSLIDDLHFKGLVELMGKKLVDNHRSLVGNLYVRQIALNRTHRESKSLRKQLIVKKSLIEQKKVFKNKLITISQGKQRIFEKFINDKKAIEKKLQGKVFAEKIKFKVARKKLLKQSGCNYIDFSRIDPEKSGLSTECKELNSIIHIESKLNGFKRDDTGNILGWPVNPYKGLSTFFHDPGYIKLLGEDHEAIDIPVAQGTQIEAPADGYVILVKGPKTLDYSFVALKHADGLVTVYGHLSKVMVKELDIVRKGEVFAKTGGTYGTPGAGFLTTGAHLHMEVWKDKKIKDPLIYMDLSYLRVNSLPVKYRGKFKSDYKGRKGYKFEGKIDEKTKGRTFKIKGDSEIERQRYFLKRYGVGSFQKWSIWVEEGIDAEIDPTFLMCVGLAETSLGKHLKTAFNVGNVGNTDSGAVKYFKSPQEGIHAMVQTFNNKYLGKYTEIQELSRYGNKTKPIYASSDFNWHNNIITCMTHIKGRFIPDSFEFRLK